MNKVPVADRLEIQEVVARYAFRCDTKNYGQVAALFTEDGTWDETVIGMPLCEGRAAIHNFFCGMADSSLEFLIHLGGNHQLTSYTGHSASGTSHLHVKGIFGGRSIEILGYYADEYEKYHDEWLLRHRRLVEIAPSVGLS
ncbi:nuclear transport factor 2 family protein [Mycobacterium sp.]|uniref:nuclear transport factor 2 family protein n=1 Tax=Mycobacterium sp. TaxID=1785 RepID=UPI00120DAA13|nr:nuclear transport factor 2 family protein [Mycobacterium sp.]TAM62843.1 MAG: nuclear transport factor 2 family protein [Mycobacterium sp.]